MHDCSLGMLYEFDGKRCNIILPHSEGVSVWCALCGCWTWETDPDNWCEQYREELCSYKEKEGHKGVCVFT